MRNRVFLLITVIALGLSGCTRQETDSAAREAGRGLGFGLSKCWRIVTDHGGQVVISSPAGGGTEVSILLPLPSVTATDCGVT